MKMIATQPIRLRADLTLAPGDEFETDEHALSKRDVAELLAIGAATVVPLAEPVEPVELAEPAEPVEPVDLAEPAKPVEPVVPAAPAGPAKPAKAAAAPKAAK